jgi:hypothetical protein
LIVIVVVVVVVVIGASTAAGWGCGGTVVEPPGNWEDTGAEIRKRLEETLGEIEESPITSGAFCKRSKDSSVLDSRILAYVICRYVTGQNADGDV